MDNFKSKNKINTLALYGGNAEHEEEWPSWPRAGMSAQRAILDVLHSDRWTVSARTRKEVSYEKKFAEKFSSFIGKNYGVSCSSGSAALKIALQAIGIKPNDEVIIPSLTWVAVGSVVAQLGGIPIFTDIDSTSLTMSVEHTKSLITSKTKAIIVAHMYSSRANMPLFRSICDEHNLPLIEDGSQAHGASIEEKKIGAFGDISIFSMQQTKLLTSGEGGIALTDSPQTYSDMQQFRADGRIYGQKDSSGFTKLEDINSLLGSNLCMSEFHAAILLEGIERLDIENKHRYSNIILLKEQIADIKGISIVEDTLEPKGGKTYYKIPIVFSKEYFEGISTKLLAEILSFELNLPVDPLDTPLHKKTALMSCIKTSISDDALNKSLPDSFPLVEIAVNSIVTLPHYCLLGVEKDIRAITRALSKVSSCSSLIAKHILKGSSSDGSL
ncbi:MAG: aminotransferase class I/II-fold pyridoxal phosphate-dependent enzyme [Colwellia sp.]